MAHDSVTVARYFARCELYLSRVIIEMQVPLGRRQKRKFANKVGQDEIVQSAIKWRHFRWLTILRRG